MGCIDSKEAVTEGNSSWTKSIDAQKQHNAWNEHSSKQNLSETLKDIEDDDAELERAATKIQASFRGHMTRKQLHEQKGAYGGDDIDLNDPELAAAATKIQASFRGHQVRRDDVLNQRQQEFYSEMEQLHTNHRPPSWTSGRR